jgi:hypothetical protein
MRGLLRENIKIEHGARKKSRGQVSPICTVMLLCIRSLKGLELLNVPEIQSGRLYDHRAKFLVTMHVCVGVAARRAPIACAKNNPNSNMKIA